MEKKGKEKKDLINNSKENYKKVSDENKLIFNGKSVSIISNGIILFCETTSNKDLYIKHYKDGERYYTEWILESNEENLETTRIISSKDSLAVINRQRDGKLIKSAKDKFAIDVEEHLIKAGEFINEHKSLVFPVKKSGLKRNKKETHLIKIANELEEKYEIIINKTTGKLCIYNERSGIYETYDENEFSALLTNSYNEKYFGDEVKRIMGTFNKIKEESEKYIALKNCLINTETLETKEFTKDEFVTFQVPYNWNPKAKSELFEEKLNEIFLDDEKRELFLQIVGYCFTPKNNHHKLFFITGDGANGKSTLMALIKAIFHESTASVGLHQFGNEFGLQPLLGKRINILSDIPKMTIDTSFIKAVTGEDSITVNRKYKEPVTRVLGCKIIGTGNQLPQVNDDSYSFWRRIIHLELKNTFKEGQKDIKLKEKLINDTEGMEWFIYESIKAYKRVEIEGWAKQMSQNETREEYLKRSNPCKYAAEQLYEKTNDPEDYVTRADVINTISEYLQDHELKQPPKKSYYMAIRSLGGYDAEKRIGKDKIRIFRCVKPKIDEKKEIEDLTNLARNGDEEAQAELDCKLLENSIKSGNRERTIESIKSGNYEERMQIIEQLRKIIVNAIG